MIGFVLYLLLLGLVAGFLARLLVPGRDPMSIGGTIVLGVVGSFIGGFLGWALFGKDLSQGALQPSGIIGSVIGAVIALLAYRAVTRRRAASRGFNSW
ncbi:MAG: putative transglycosylase associated protein [Actinomycetia bacterium]|nr:putative transglycosylase associated protein [Actinomycetes bacterium]